MQVQKRKSELEETKKKISQLDNAIQRLYVDMAKGLITEERFSTLYKSFEAEQKTFFLTHAKRAFTKL